MRTVLGMVFTFLAGAVALAASQVSPGTVVQVKFHAADQTYKMPYIYLGHYGDRELGLLDTSSGLPNNLVIFSDAAKYGLNPGANDWPQIIRQRGKDYCLPTAIAYIEDLLKLPQIEGKGQSLRADELVSSLTPSSLSSPLDAWMSLNPFFPKADQAVAAKQEEAIKSVLAADGIEFTATADFESLIEALRGGKIALLAVATQRSELSIGDENDNRVDKDILLPSRIQQLGHAMVALSLLETKKQTVVLLADPYSGELVPITVEMLQESKPAIFTIDSPSRP